MNIQEDDKLGNFLDQYFPKDDIEDFYLKRYEQMHDLMKMLDIICDEMNKGMDWSYDEACNKICLTRSVFLDEMDFIRAEKRSKYACIIQIIASIITYIIIVINFGLLKGLYEQITLMLCSILFGESALILYKYRKIKERLK